MVWKIFDFPIYWECHDPKPNWRSHIFQRGRSTTNQQLSPAEVEISRQKHERFRLRWCQRHGPGPQMRVGSAQGNTGIIGTGNWENLRLLLYIACWWMKSKELDWKFMIWITVYIYLYLYIYIFIYLYIYIFIYLYIYIFIYLYIYIFIYLYNNYWTLRYIAKEFQRSSFCGVFHIEFWVFLEKTLEPVETNPRSGERMVVTVDARNPAPVDRWFIPLFIGFSPSVWWCRISSTHRRLVMMSSIFGE